MINSTVQAIPGETPCPAVTLGDPGRGSAARGVLQRIRAKGVIWIAAHSALYAWDKVFDFVFYPLAVIELGLVAGTAVMMAASFAICLVLLLLYDRLAHAGFRDLLCFESIKEAATAVRRSRFVERASLANGAASRGAARAASFLYLSLWFDPMTCTIFMRPAECYSMSPRLWAIFFASVVVSNLCWAAFVYLGVESMREIVSIFV